MQALTIYRETYRPSAEHPAPYSMAGVMVVLADTDEAAQYLFTSVQQKFKQMRSGGNTPFPKPVDSMDGLWTAADQQMVDHVLKFALVGTKASVKEKLRQFVQMTKIDELIVSLPIYDHDARMHSLTLLSELQSEL
jgi:alkanesulfonate monooxygenase SsuD/methylene tetrahydromethanopterin reductase-like flavin-dependent oxidoreductase (luciferase family)